MSNTRPGWLATDNLRTRSDAIAVEVGGTVVRRVFCVGMAGTGMKAIAEWFSAAGWQVSGSDRSASPPMRAKFERLGIELLPEHSAENLPPHLDLLIYSPAVRELNPERQAAQERGIPQWSYPQVLGQLMRGREGISIAGTHGKSTTTALVGHILRHAGLAPSILCGAEMLDTGLNGVLGQSFECRSENESSRSKNKRQLLVAESCEYRGHFLELTPRVVGLLGIEPDHFDCFPTFDLALATYQAFLEKLPPDGLLIVNRDCEASCSIAPSCPARQVFVSTTDERADYFVQRADSDREGLNLTVRLPDESTINIKCPLWGQHHAINVVTALAIAREQGISGETCREAIATFAGIGRRFEYRGDWNGVTWIDDYAHHPTAVRAVLDATRDRFPGRRVWCVFQPHQVSRTRELAEGFVNSLQRADGVMVLPVFGAREASGTAQNDLARQLVDCVNRLGVTALFVGDLDHTRTTLETHTRPGDVVLTVGAGDIDRIYHEFTGRLQTHHAS